ncbi:phenazine-specific anthranilate synthase component I [Streptomyces sp. HNM0575]|uniref:anthranilate synthase family protein n=1 Tax=Streptomyces sp. HNM0575 TaxID=2716338 RepID=UPI00145EDB3D|nr:anthranilate synthase family protein [Streptomyces sp. HNM0575]NLU74538.1 phenazine-specific anthranilate synthase component I [Streptomyces sp. HNM0575]
MSQHRPPRRPQQSRSASGPYAPAPPADADADADRDAYAPPPASEIVGRLLRDDAPPFALLRRRTPGRPHDTVEVLTGPVHEAERLADIPDGGPRPGYGALALVPFRQIRERGFRVRDDGTPLAVLLPREVYELPLADVAAALPAHRVNVEDGAFDVSDKEYARTVRRVVEDEIGTGEGADFVVRRTFEGRIPGFSRADALALFGRLLSGERGAYWTFVVHTGERVLAGASPEVHVRMSGGTVVMNPISGTYRYPPGGPSAEGLLDFLADRKESEELSMVVDEELKMMCTVGDMGGVVVGPRLKEMAHLAHTEYELRGRSTLDVREVLRETMFAATVTGSPVENACRVIERHEPGGRGYYAGALALVGRDAGGAQTLDSPILIRTADVDAASGLLRVPVGATLVRASQPASEVAETHAKAAGVLTALGVREAPAHRRRAAPAVPLADDPRVRAALAARRADLAPFWLRMQTGGGSERPERGPRPGTGDVLMVDGEDTFTSMLAHLLRATGAWVEVRRFDEPGLREAALAHGGPVVLGPGPGDPRDLADPKIRVLRDLAAELLREHRHGLLGVCLGHQLLAVELGLEIVRKSPPCQGAQETVGVFGREETVGLYNSYAVRCGREEEGRAGGARLPGRVEADRDPVTGEVHSLRGEGFASVQFHPESVLTLNGPGIVAEMLEAAAGAGARRGAGEPR